VCIPGVGTFSGLPPSRRPGSHVQERPYAGASSTFTAYPHAAHRTRTSSPLGVVTWNSWLRSPPIAPVSAWTARNSNPSRAMILAYVTTMPSYERLAASASASNE
jgi:hypothetical protein